MFVRWTRRLTLVALTVAAAMAASACEDVKDPFDLSATPVTYTETFSGTLAPGGSATHPFVVTVSGTVTLTLTAVTPDSALTLGFDIGTWDGTTCNPIFGTGFRNAVQTNSFAGSAIVGNFCARVYDGDTKIPVDTTASYTITVLHP
jgi:hypothetical protein